MGVHHDRLRLRQVRTGWPERTPGSVSAAWEEAVRRRHGGPEAALLPPERLERFRTEWEQLCTDFANHPRAVLERANELVVSLLRELEDGFSGERERIEQEWAERNSAPTRELRIALTRYRTLFERLLPEMAAVNARKAGVAGGTDAVRRPFSR